MNKEEEFKKWKDIKVIPHDLQLLSRAEYKQSIADGDIDEVAKMDASGLVAFYMAWDIQQKIIDQMKNCSNCKHGLTMSQAGITHNKRCRKCHNESMWELME